MKALIDGWKCKAGINPVIVIYYNNSLYKEVIIKWSIKNTGEM